jgi:hypothetical protein
MKSQPTPEQLIEIEKLAFKYRHWASKSNRETAYQDAERMGMDIIREYCRKRGIATLGEHMVAASLTINP